ncbi:MarR family winged helix-turn-helix transcriptional regulator [Clostridium beijerinckii]|uniref:HTH marR-type domain-containing protein n=1 Tax=Clostridium beijerinckii TaxID=1520 RepID=A0A1S9N454_CLOBE|nr:MarR family transcriptional regulator [Clostridium beijerinckii]MZK51438.1 winged helix DNA-binding protein [Clostridium beijerinckii]MZK59638.1 winged helix DNA-binding protein [Clostridium beijerinckii]MZK69758.1 winged helix DNA-binding protein [Clostridium beijerinckii]MZK75136.1 winged helix DNA-binding protein [Clostridium beijerinckii]MZK84848.1 winged helix DNA-binding protein [Clostridium beijerinckii]
MVEKGIPMNKEFVITRKILKLGNQLINTRNEDFHFHDITAEQSETLQFFDVHKGSSASDLKKYLGVSHQAARNIIERMKKKELLYVEVSEEDARARLVYLTEKGQKVCKALKRDGTNMGQRLLNGLDSNERKQLLEMIEKMERNIE